MTARHVVITSLGILGLIGCGRQQDIITARTYHNMVSQYNTLFNGQQALLRAQESIRTGYEEDYDELLPVFIVGDEQAASAVKPDLEKAIEKSTKVIQQHSMMIQNQQKNKVIDDAYLLMGQARYFDRDYLKALETFNYIIQAFSKKDADRLRAEYWAARTETALDNYLNARDRFERIYRDNALPKDLKAPVYAAYAQLEIDHGSKNNAYQLLKQAIDKSRNKDDEIRWLYIAAQLQAQLGGYYEASRLFKKVIKKGPPYEMLFNAQLSRARAYDVDLQDPADVYDELEKMLADEKNYDNRDKIYYVMAEVANRLDDLAQVINYLNLSIAVSTKNQEQKALSYLWLAEINFEDKHYEAAQAYYDSCYQSLPKDHPRYEEVQALKESLGKLVANLNTIATQDSLLALSGMSEKQRMAVVEKIIEAEREKQAEKERAERRAAMEQMAFNNQGGSNGPAEIAGSGKANKQFYFYNPTLRSTGASTFAQRWGNRKLEDHWRRSNKQRAVVELGDNKAAASAGDSTGSSGDSQGQDPRFNPETYLQNIPESEEALAAAHQKIQDALLDNGMIYKEEIKDLLAAERSLQEILKRYPDYADKARVWYILYRIHVISENSAEAERYKKLILVQFPDSEFAYLIRNEGKDKDEASESEIKQAYAQAYARFSQADYRSALDQAKRGFESYQGTSYGPMFLLLQALCEGYLGQEAEYRQSLKSTVSRYPKTEQAQRAQEMLDRIQSEAGGGAENPDGAAKAATYRTDFSAMHRFVVVIPNGKASANNINIALSDFNRKYFPNDPLRSKTIMLGSDQQVIMVSGLPNKQRAQQYQRTLANEKKLERYLVGVDNKQFVISNANFSTFYTSQDLPGYLKFYEEHYK